jgi:hypothetical protein
VAQRAAELSAQDTVYFGVVIQKPDCKPDISHRSTTEGAYIVIGLWFDLDLAFGLHAASSLPATVEEGLAVLHGLQAPPSLILHSGGGLYGFWQFREPYMIASPADHEAITQLSQQFHYTVRLAGKAKGWTFDNTGDLSRVLRPAGTINYKYGTRVEVIHETGIRYNPSDFDWLEALPEPARTSHAGAAIPGQPNLVAIAEHYGAQFERKSEAELAAAHPQHGSSTGDNFNVNAAKGLWHCWRHTTGGDALALIAVCEGLVPCEDMRAGVLRGEAFKRVVDIANTTFQAGIVLDAARRRNGPGPGPQPTDPYACPELPAAARVDEARAAQASIFLDDYIAFSQQWAPRAYQGFHEAAALFALSTTAARRVRIEFGPQGVYTSLYMALASRTSLFTKTTAVKIALALLRAAGLRALLADNDATPQAFLRSLTLYVPPDYAELPPEVQAEVRERLAFAGQKGWFYEEWGQHLHAMMQKEGQMAHFRGIMKRLDDHEDEYSYATISRGRDILHKPYVTLLANVTPADLKPFFRTQSPLWRDGYIARMAFITPPQGQAGSTARFPEGAMKLPRRLITSLQSWHQRLGIPRVTLEPILDNKDKPTGRFRPAFVQAHQETTYRLSPEVREAFNAYDDAIHALIAASKNDNLDGSYVRFPAKALRIAGLLASLHDDSTRYTIQAPQWYRGQQIAERWRQNLHAVIAQTSDDESTSRESKSEQRLMAVLQTHGDLSVRDLNRWSKLGHGEILQSLRVLCEAGAVQEIATARTKKYHYVLDGDPIG